MNKYFKEYQWPDIFAMIRNLKLDPEICMDDSYNQLVVITGATSGIGKAAAHKYAAMGATILSVNRNEEKSINLCETLRSQYGVDSSYLIADFSRLADTHKVAKQLAALDRNIDVLIHNAGVHLSKRTLTEDQLEKVFQVNYLSSFILNYYLKEKFIKQNSGRILFVNSEAHRFSAWGLHLDDLAWEKHSYSGLKSYGAAKMAQLLSMIKLNEYFSGTGVTINAMHPGNVKTNSGHDNGKFYKLTKKIFIDSKAIPIENASEALYYLGVSKKVEGVSGKFFNLTTEEKPAPPASDREESEKLWLLSLELGGLK